MAVIRVNIRRKPIKYEIRIGEGILPGQDFARFGKRFVTIVDSSLENHPNTIALMHRLEKEQKLANLPIYLPGGESLKTPEQATELGRFLAREKIGKMDHRLIVVGGGSLGDLVGYVASFYDRSLGFIYVATTLLAMLDAAIGGKNAVNIPEGKNLFGRIHQPLLVVNDVSWLKTLPGYHISNGLAEAAKMGVTLDEGLFDLVTGPHSLNSEFYMTVIERSGRLKVPIVEVDELDSGPRNIFNYGHTVGPPIEAATDYKVHHGPADSVGMAVEGYLAAKLGFFPWEALMRQNSGLAALGLPVRLRDVYNGTAERLIDFMLVDKKTRDGKPYFVHPVAIGKVYRRGSQVAFPVEIPVIHECLTDLLAQ
ncbi:3-dehydroquinate synthase [Candidatus Woesearchaeota archaeon]|nr:3-dehydroquinate synthase [Candidatus Woesearchaeota archaeon]